MGNVIMSGIVPPLEKPVGGTPIADVAVGSIVKLNESGSPVEFYVAKHDYESGLNGAGRTLLVRKECYDKRVWHSTSVNAYASSDLDSWFNSTYKALLDTDVQSAIGATEFYYTPGNGDYTVTTLARSIFALSPAECGRTYNFGNTEGSALPIASILAIATLNGSTVYQWTRSPRINYVKQVCLLNLNGSPNNGSCTDTNGVRPCFTLSETALVADDGTIIV